MDNIHETETISTQNSGVGLKRKTSKIASSRKPSIVEEFSIGKKLGEGKFGTVHLALHRKTGSLYALKKIGKASIKSHMMVNQLAVEVRVHSCLSHRNILGMVGFFEDRLNFYMLLEYMEGSLFDRLRESKKLKEEDTAKIMRQVVDAVESLHDLGIAHRDLKP